MHWERVKGARNAKKTGYCMFRSRQRILGHDRGEEMLRQAAAGFRSRQGIPGRDRVLSGFVSRQEFLCRNMVLRF